MFAFFKVVQHPVLRVDNLIICDWSAYFEWVVSRMQMANITFFFFVFAVCEERQGRERAQAPAGTPECPWGQSQGLWVATAHPVTQTRATLLFHKSQTGSGAPESLRRGFVSRGAPHGASPSRAGMLALDWSFLRGCSIPTHTVWIFPTPCCLHACTTWNVNPWPR